MSQVLPEGDKEEGEHVAEGGLPVRQLVVAGAAVLSSLALAGVIMRSSDGSFWEKVGSRSASILATARKAEARVAVAASASHAHGARAIASVSTTAPASRPVLPALSASSAEAVDPVDALRSCLLDKKTTTYSVASFITKSKKFAGCYLDECDNADMKLAECRLPAETFAECFEPFNRVNRDMLIKAEACTQRLQSLSVDKYIEKHAVAF